MARPTFLLNNSFSDPETGLFHPRGTRVPAEVFHRWILAGAAGWRALGHEEQAQRVEQHAADFAAEYPPPPKRGKRGECERNGEAHEESGKGRCPRCGAYL